MNLEQDGDVEPSRRGALAQTLLLLIHSVHNEYFDTTYSISQADTLAVKTA